MPLVSYAPVRGAEDVQRAITLASEEVRKEIRTKLRAYVEPVRADAQLYGAAIGAGTEWSQMRSGSTRSMGYVAPRERGTRDQSRKRRNFAGRLLRRAMIPALDKNRHAIGQRFDAFLGRVERAFNRGGS